MSGGCFCGRVRYRATVAGEDAYLCHCRMCRRASGGVSVAFVGVNKADVRWESAPGYLRSSPVAERGFCAGCGTSLSFAFLDSDSMDLTVGSFDDPKGHFAIESRLDAWTDTSHLPGKRTEENKPLVDRWMKAVGKLPD